MEFFLQFIEITIPSVIVFLTAFFIIKSFFAREEAKNKEIRKTENAKITVPLRIQAYERMVLFLERINPESLLLRVQTQQMTAGQLHQDLLITIRAEFEHNLSQQIYITQESWNAVKEAKNHIIKIINEESAKIAAIAPASALSEAVLKAIITTQNNPIQKALTLLKTEAENYM